MELDYFVYSRGVAQTDGYAFRIAPDYIPKKACIAFLDKTNKSRDSQIWNDNGTDPFELFPDARKNSFVYIDVERAKSCLLMRTVPICSENGKQMVDFQGRLLWSLEGVCCPYEQRFEFFAALPSLLLALKQDSRTLHEHFREGLTKYTVPDSLLFNAYAGGDFPECTFNIITDEAEQTEFLNLTNSICVSDEPFSFYYGALARNFMALTGSMYKISLCYDFLRAAEKEYRDTFFDEYKPLDICVQPAVQRTELVLECGISRKKDTDELLWRIRSAPDSPEPYELLSAPEPINAENGKRMLDMLARAESLRDFAKKMQWEEDSNNRFKYYKEG